MTDKISAMNLLYFSKTAILLYTVLVAVIPSPSIAAEDYDQAPINYSQAKPENAVSRLIEEVQVGKAVLEYKPSFGYLPSLLKALKVPESSQTLVYSKTSLQRDRISPRTPRALYFNDDVYVGFCQNGDVLEISAADPKLGTVFYTLSQEAGETPKILRQGDNCLICHGSSQTRYVPGHVLRSVFVHPSGLPILSAATSRTDHTSPIAERWGGWYVTGTHGQQKHLGNLVIRSRDVPHDVDNSDGMNLTELGGRFDATRYLSGQSDIVALLVLAHQVEAHNRIARLNFATRQALHYQQILNRELRESADHVWDSTKSRIKSAGEPLVEYLLFSEEAEIEHCIAGTSNFTREFAQQGPRDRQGRSLRDFDLERRLFRYPCSYLIYSPSFQDLPAEAKQYVFERLWSILNGQDQSKQFSHLTPDDRQAILQILQDTLPSLPESWRAPTPSTSPTTTR